MAHPEQPVDLECACEDGSRAMSLSQAKQLIFSNLIPIEIAENVALEQAYLRILASDIFSPSAVPSFDNSAMDGYAFRAHEVADIHTCRLKIAGEALAGKPFMSIVPAGHCIRIMTGAPLPPDLDTVIMQEQVQAQDGWLRINTPFKPRQHVRYSGEDIQKNQKILAAGKALGPADVGLLASLGISTITVKKKLQVAFCSTGDEVCALDQPLKPGQIYDSNRYILRGLLSPLNLQLTDLGIIPDDPAQLKTMFENAGQNAQVLITTGGVSVGEADYVKKILESLGEILLWKIAMKPGKPLVFGQIKNCWYFGLPGNPVSAMATFYQIVQPALDYLAGATPTQPLSFQVPCVSPLRKSPGRQEFQRGILFHDDNGQLVVKSAGKQGSHILSAMSTANCFIVLPQETSDVTPGTLVLVQVLSAKI